MRRRNLHRVTPKAFMVFVTAVSAVVGDVNSANHPVLKRTLERHPDSDADKNGSLSFAEYTAFVEKQGPRKQENGQPAGPISTVLPNGDVVVSDFEENNLGRMRQWGWTIEGEAFNRDLNTGTRIMKRRAGTYHGRYLLTSMIVSDADVGQVLSPGFDVELGFIEVVMSGGQYPHRVCVNLLVDDKVVRSATGRNDDLLETVALDVAAYKGKKARVQIVDAHRKIWGHLNVDRIYQTAQTSAERVITEAPKSDGAAVTRIQTLSEQRQGPLTIREGKLAVRGQSVELDSLLLAVCEHDSQEAAAGSALRLVNGEVWQARITGLEKELVSIESPLFGKRDVPVAQIASLEFSPGSTGAGEAGTLYRSTGEPIPGKLVWIRDKDIAIDCPLGVVPIPRGGVQRFVVANVDPKLARGGDELGLTDGSLFRGELAVDNDNLVLNHPSLGALSFDWKAVDYLQRTPEGVSWLDRLEPAGLEQVGPILPPPAPSVSDGDRGYLRVMRMLPRTAARYELAAAGSSNFRAQLRPVAGSRAGVTVKLSAGDHIVWEQRVSGDAEPIAIAVDLQNATELTIEVDFDERLAFPCGVEWLDAHILTKK